MVLSDGRLILVAQSQIQGQIWSKSPVILKIQCIQPLGLVALGISVSNFSERRRAGQKIFEARRSAEGCPAREKDLTLAASERTLVDAAVANFEAELETVLAAQI